MTRFASYKLFLAVLLLIGVTLVAGCGNIYSRDDFTTAVIGKTEQEVIQQFGTPDSVDERNPDRVVWTYDRKTFDLGNANKIDSRTTVVFEHKGQDRQARATVLRFG
jgi:hypothetical protein